MQVFLRWFQRKRIDREVPRVLADIQVRSAKDRRERFVASANVEDVGLRLVLLRVLEQECAQKSLPASGHSKDERVRDFSVMEVQEVRRRIFRLKDSEVLRPEMGVSLFSREDGEKKRQVRIVGIEQV